MRLFTLFPNLITTESYNWWVTRRFWGFRQQISKAKYLKISQNIGGKYQEASGEHRSTVQNFLRNSPFLSGVRIPDVNIRVEVASAGYKLAAAGYKLAAVGYKMAAAGCKLAAVGCKSYSDMWSGRPPMVYPDALSEYTPCMDSK